MYFFDGHTMSYSNDSHNAPRDVAFRPAGIGSAHTWRCMGCNVCRSTMAGSRGAGVKKRCAVCVAAKQARVVG